METSFVIDSCSDNPDYDFHNMHSDETTADNAGYANCFYEYENLNHGEDGGEDDTNENEATNDSKMGPVLSHTDNAQRMDDGEEQPGEQRNAALDYSGYADAVDKSNVNATFAAVADWQAQFKQETKNTVHDAASKVEVILEEMKGYSQSIMQDLNQFLLGTDSVIVEYYTCRDSQMAEADRLGDMGPRVETACEQMLARAAATAGFSGLAATGGRR